MVEFLYIGVQVDEHKQQKFGIEEIVNIKNTARSSSDETKSRA